MAPRNPKEKHQEDVQKEAPQAIDNTFNNTPEAPVDPVQHSVPLVDPQQEEALDTRVELDRLEIYLKGPTAFTA